MNYLYIRPKANDRMWEDREESRMNSHFITWATRMDDGAVN